MKFCTQCGAELPDGAAFCPKCGTAAAPRTAEPSIPYIPDDPEATVYMQPNEAQPAYAPPAYTAPQPNEAQPAYAPPAYTAPQPNGYAPQPNGYAAPTYTTPAYRAPATVPAATLKTNRTLLKLILLSLITFGIYGLVVMTQLTNDVNTIVSPHDGKKSMHYCLLCFLIAPITLGIAGVVWSHKISNRIGGELTRRGINYSFGAGTFWGWGVLGSFILVGPYIYCHKLLKSVNLLAENYNTCGW